MSVYDAPQIYRWRDPRWPREIPSLQVHFTNDSQVNEQVTRETGIQTYDNVLVAHIYPMGMPKSDATHEVKRTLPDNTVKIHPQNAARFGEQLKLYEAGTEAEKMGTPLRDLVGMTPATILNLKARGIHTIEDLSEMGDTAGNDLMGFWDLRDRAKKHIEHREKQAPMLKLEMIEEKHAQEVASLRRQLEDLKALIPDQPEKRGPGRPRKDAEAA
jgi:hypothetical protein